MAIALYPFFPSLSLASYRPTQGSSFISTPPEIVHKNAVVNVHNPDDDKCFLWAVLAALHPVDGKSHPNRLYHYKPYENELNTTGLTYPLPLSQVPKFETLNPNISVSVLVYEERQLIPLYTSPHRQRKHTIHLLLISDDTKHHYTTVRNLSRLVCGRTKHEHKTHVCP